MRTRYMLLVHLRARRPDGRAAAGIEQAELDSDRVRHFAHDAAERIDLAHQMALGDSADRRIAGHLGDQVEVHRDHGGAQAHAGAGPRRLAAGVAGADDHDVVTLSLHCYHCSSAMRILIIGGGGASMRWPGSWRNRPVFGVRGARESGHRTGRRHAYRHGRDYLEPPKRSTRTSPSWDRKRRWWLAWWIVPRARPHDRRTGPRTPPNWKAARFSQRTFCVQSGIPTARIRHSGQLQPRRGRRSTRFGFPVVLKADGLAAGKGVIIAHDRAEAEAALSSLKGRLVIEEFLTGEEVSFIVLCDGRDMLPLAPTQDHKAVFDGDTGPNTGGMGAYCDAAF